MSQDKARLNELQGALRQKMADNKAIADSFRVENGTVVVSTDQKTAFDKNMSDIKEIKSLIDGMETMNNVDAWSAEPQASVSSQYAAASAEMSQLSSREIKTIGEMFLESAEFKALANGRNGANMASPWQVKASFTGGMQYKAAGDIYTALPTGELARGARAEFGTIQRDPMVISPMRTKRVRDLFPVRTTTAAVIEYFRQIGFTTLGAPGIDVSRPRSASGSYSTNNAAAGVAQRDGSTFALKPQSAFQFEGHQAPVRTLAHWEAAHRNVLADEPQLRSIIDNELMYGLRLLEDNQILNGDGTGENLLGVLRTPGIQEYNWSDGAVTPVPDSKADAIRRAATLSFLAYYEPSGVVLHPNDWEDMELTKDKNGQYLIAVSVAMGGEPKVWRMPVIDTPAIDEGTALVGAFGTGAQLYDREQASIRISEQHSDFFVRNAIVVLAEQRLALAVKRPEAFVAVSFDEAPSA
jgi:HK97 family phage major capsid protein